MQTNEPIAWPPAYTIKKHKRAKSVKLRAAERGLVITIPYRLSVHEIPAILEENKAWIVKQLSALPKTVDKILPQHIHLQAIHEHWSIHYLACQRKLSIIQRPQHEIVLTGEISNQSTCFHLLTAWVKVKAKQVLIERLHHISREIGLTFKSVKIRDQKTLWGSCTVSKAISLNYKLIFLPEALMDYVIIHELCHTVYLNHSDKFWALVGQYDAAYETHKKVLKAANQFMPAWL